MKNWRKKLAPIDQSFNQAQQQDGTKQVQHIQPNNGKVSNIHTFDNERSEETEALQEPLNKTPVSLKVSLIFIPLIIVGLILMTVLPVYLAQAEELTTIVIMGTNDIHGKVYPTRLFRSDTKEEYKYGGLTYLLSLMKIVSDQYKNNSLYFDAGDQYQGGIQASKYVSNGSIMNDFFQRANLQGSAIGNHEFDDNPTFLFNYLKGRTSPNLAANIYSEKNQRNFLPNQVGEKVYTLPSGIKIGVIGLTTKQTLSTTATFNNGKFPRYSFMDYKDIVIEKSNKLKQQGVNAVIIVSHVGDSCTNNFTNSKRNSTTNSTPCPYDQISKLIESLPPGTIHGIVQGHRHRTAHHYLNSIPYMGVPSGGYYLNFMYLTFNKKKELVQSFIEGPVPVCEKIFKNLKTCEYIQQNKIQEAGQLQNWKFHGVEVKADSEFDMIIQEKYSQKMGRYLQEIVKSQIFLSINKTGESQLGNLFCDLLLDVANNITFSILNSGGFRTQWYPGIITYEHYFNMFPFDNQIQTFEIDGMALNNSIKELIQNGTNDIFATSNLEIHIKKYGNGTKQVVCAKINGNFIENKLYKGVTINFLLNGGDAFSKVINRTYIPLNVQTIGEFRSTLKDRLKNVNLIRAGQYMNSTNPRYNFTMVA